ncbi:DNA topoisomerase IB [Solirubrobacter soli]|uniref:DNA topoisomerase IB n=1 Tax=Solirubrobacter soli TaxID=363832 RepID=UPI00069F613B|nr:DNA topoisomerase IB [Solirubrobacter soli]
MTRLRRADCSGPGITRRRAGRGFAYYEAGGERVTEPDVVERIRALGIPPAWKDVWICTDPNGHLQATGIDAAGRKQYRYHDAWRVRRDAEKFEDMTRFAKALPRLREQVEADLAGTDALTRERVLACAVRLLDRGFFRIGTEAYTESFGLATMRKRHVRVEDGQMVFDFPAKSGQRRIQGVVDPIAQDVVCSLKRRRGGGPELLAYKDGRGWVDLRSDDINDYLKERTGGDFSAKDFRTWSATVIAALAVAVSGPAFGTKTSRQRAITRAVKETAHYLGNTPAVCRASYIDPRVFDAYRGGLVLDRELIEAAAEPGSLPTQHPAIERAVLDLIDEREHAPGVANLNGV